MIWCRVRCPAHLISLASGLKLTTIGFDFVGIEFDMCNNTDAEEENTAKSDAEARTEHFLSSPVSVANCLDIPDSALAVAAAAADSVGISTPYADGKFEVQRSARKRRIKRGCLASNSDDYRTYDVSYRIFRPELLSLAHAPLIVLHGGP